MIQDAMTELAKQPKLEMKHIVHPFVIQDALNDGYVWSNAGPINLDTGGLIDCLENPEFFEELVFPFARPPEQPVQIMQYTDFLSMSDLVAEATGQWVQSTAEDLTPLPKL
jgi:hypothetical protein